MKELTCISRWILIELIQSALTRNYSLTLEKNSHCYPSWMIRKQTNKIASLELVEADVDEDDVPFVRRADCVVFGAWCDPDDVLVERDDGDLWRTFRLLGEVLLSVCSSTKASELAIFEGMLSTQILVRPDCWWSSANGAVHNKYGLLAHAV